jgi:signal transduction histidine kinase
MTKWLLIGCFWMGLSLFGKGGASIAQQKDTLRQRPNNNLLLLHQDTTNFEDKYIVSELEKVQYANYSENLKKIALEKLLENQKLQNTSLQQKLQNEQIKAEATRKQAQAQHQQELQRQKIKQLEINELNQRLTLQNRTRNFLLGGLGLLTLLGLSLFWSNQQLKKRNRAIQKLSAENLEKEQEKQQILATQNETLERQVTERTAELNHSLTELKATQNQLIQKEKLASLGELTAGIAHEIQNPLNFVNNFSELSTELLEELKDELPEELKTPPSGAGGLLADLTQNLEKINLHGKRASSIVKGMLEHSRMGTGERVLTDLNALCDECLRLSYHGMRAKDKNFNANYELIADPNLPKVNVVPQEIGRVLLNLINNAFYAVRTIESPKVTVTALQGDKQLIIKVQDNGMGIPDAIKAKIFQPFFTTKPTGQGTGLGLSLAYDIVTKGHGGTIGMESTEGIGSEFTITLHL